MFSEVFTAISLKTCLVPALSPFVKVEKIKFEKTLEIRDLDALDHRNQLCFITHPDLLRF